MFLTPQIDHEEPIGWAKAYEIAGIHRGKPEFLPDGTIDWSNRIVVYLDEKGDLRMRGGLLIERKK